MAQRGVSFKTAKSFVFKTFAFTGLYMQAMGNPEANGIWVIYGPEKNGKTWWALMLAEYLSQFEKVLYISAEEGLGMDFVAAGDRANLSLNNPKLMLDEYMSIEDLKEKLRKRKSPRIVFLDNATIYNDEFKKRDLYNLKEEFPDVLFIILAHEEKGEPYAALGRMSKKLAKIIMRVQGLTAHISGRVPGGKISIDETKAALYWGEPELINNEQLN